jgi:hypothetical protein
MILVIAVALLLVIVALAAIVVVALRSPPQQPSGPPMGQAQPVMGYVVPTGRANLGAPGIGVAGFVLSLLGISVIGIVLSWVGYAQAKREGRPSSLCLAGIIIGFVWLATLIGVSITLYAIGSGQSI